MFTITRNNFSLGFVLLAVLAPSWSYALDLSMFADVQYRDSDKQGDKNAFVLGPVDLYAMQYVDDKTRAFTEIVVESRQGEFGIDVERLWISRNLSENLSFSAGRFHTPLGYWNRTYHHGALLSDTISRPFFLDFEEDSGSIMPMHFVGVMMLGDVPVNGGFFEYQLHLGNGPSLDTSPSGTGDLHVNTEHDHNRAKSPGLRVVYHDNDLPLQVGVFGMRNDISEAGLSATSSGLAAGDTLVEQTIYGLDMNLRLDHLDATAEWYRLKNDDVYASAGSHVATAYYLQLGYRLSYAIKPVYRYEALNTEAADVYFNLLNVQQTTRQVLALRYDLDENNALKFEITRPKIQGQDGYTTFGAQWAFLLE